MTSAKLEALKALVLTLLSAAAATGVIATDLPNVLAPVVAAAGAVLGVFLIHRPQDVATNQANAAVADTVQIVGLTGLPTHVDVAVGPADAAPEDQATVPVLVTPAGASPVQPQQEVPHV